MLGMGEISREARLRCSDCGRTTKHSTDIGSKSWDAGYIECTVCGTGRKFQK